MCCKVPFSELYFNANSGLAKNIFFCRRRRKFLRPDFATRPTWMGTPQNLASPDERVPRTLPPPSDKIQESPPQGRAFLYFVAGAGLAPATSRL